jgi:hypothetical protein
VGAAVEEMGGRRDRAAVMGGRLRRICRSGGARWGRRGAKQRQWDAAGPSSSSATRHAAVWPGDERRGRPADAAPSQRLRACLGPKGRRPGRLTAGGWRRVWSWHAWEPAAAAPLRERPTAKKRRRGGWTASAYSGEACRSPAAHWIRTGGDRTSPQERGPKRRVWARLETSARSRLFFFRAG